MNRIFRSLFIVTLILAATVARAADWPTYLNGNDRVGATDTRLKLPLVLRWEYTSPAPPEMAWAGPREDPIEGKFMRHRVAFDDALHVAIVGGRVFYGSSVDQTIYCVDEKTGKTMWTHPTDGPVRLAPTVADGKVYVGSDDGYIYCLTAKTGKLVWKLRVAAKDERVLARGRMISRWPVRTSVLVDKGIAYFGAGIFPHETIYMCAADAATGKFIWRNDTISQQNAGRNDLSPQGYLLCNDELLFIPSGRTLPHDFDKKTGKLVHNRSFGWRGTAGGVIGGSKALLADGQLFTAGAHHFLAMNEKTGSVGHAWIPGRQMVVAGEKAYIATGTGRIIAVERKKNAQASTERQKLFLKQGSLRGKPKELAALRKQMAALARAGEIWSTDSLNEAALVQAGDVVFAGGDNEVIALDEKTGKLLWSAKVQGKARGLAVAGNSLIVSTDLGKIYRFAGAGEPTASKAVAQYPGKLSPSPYPADELTDVYAKAAKAILLRSGQKSGFCYVVGAEQGRLAYELARRSDLRIVGIEPDAKKVAAARAALSRAGMFGSRVIIVHGDPKQAPFSNYFANLVVSDTLLLTGKLPCEPADVGRHVKPCGGVVCFGNIDAEKIGSDPQQFTKTIFLKADVASSDADRRWATLTRGKLPGAGEWSHQYGNVANTNLSEDHRIKGGLGVLWYGDPGPTNMVNRHSAAAAPLSTNGRMFIQGIDSVMAYDAYNGQFLWNYKNPGAIRTGVFNNAETSNLAANDDALFVAVGDTCTVLEADSGKIRVQHKTPKSPDGIPRAWGYVAVHDGVLYGSSTIRSELARSLRRRGRVINSETDAVFAYDAATGKKLWTYRGKNILHTTIAIGEGKMFFIDASLTKQQRDELLQQDKTELKKLTGDAAKKAEAEIKRKDLRLAVALDAKTGVKLWEVPVDVTDATHVSSGGGNLALMYHDGYIVLCGANANGHYWRQFLSGQFSRRRLVVHRASDGEKIWAKDANYMNRPLVIGDQIIAEPFAYDLRTGEEKKRIHPLTGKETTWRFSRPGHHCGIITATPNMMFFRSGFIGYYDLYDDEGTKHFAGQRLGCWINAIPGNGVVMIPEASAGCVCLFSITSTVVLEPREDRHAWGIYSVTGADTPVKHMAVNLGAPGDRRDQNGVIWFGYPRPRSAGRLEFMFDLKPKFTPGGSFDGGNSESIKVTGTESPWVYASQARGLARLELKLLGKDDRPARYTVKLHFAASKNGKPGKRLFDVKLQGVTVAENLDVARAAGGPGKALVKQFKGVTVTDHLILELVPRAEKPTKEQLPAIAGIEVTREAAE